MSLDARSTILVAAGGAAGAVLRWALVTWTAGGATFPWWTLLVNVLGCFGFGTLYAAHSDQRLALGIGLCGGLTTFSTFSVELAVLLDSGGSGDAAVAGSYLGASLVLGTLAVLAGRRVAPAW